MAEKAYKYYRYRLYPNKRQEEELQEIFEATRRLFNAQRALVLGEEGAKEDLKKIAEKYRHINVTVMQDARKRFERSYWEFQKGRKQFPKEKREKERKKSFRMKNYRKSIRLWKGKLHLDKVSGWLRLAYHRELGGYVTSAVVSYEITGKYFVSLCFQEAKEALPKRGREIGIDLGVMDFLIFSNGKKVPNPHFRNPEDRKLKREQRKLTRKRKQAVLEGRDLNACKNYQKQRKKVARLQERIRERRKHFLHLLSKRLLEYYDVIYLEDLACKEIMQKGTRCIAAGIAELAWSDFVAKLKYKAKWYDKELIQVDRFFPSSQLCSYCGSRRGKLPASIRSWDCPHCGRRLDRDVNAARNIFLEGQALRKKANPRD